MANKNIGTQAAKKDWLNKSTYEKAKKAVESWPDWKRKAYNQMVGCENSGKFC